MKPVVIIPTYNERDNIGPLLDALLSLPVENLRVIVVDDNSPDGTSDYVAGREALTQGRVRLLRRPSKMGLGSAYVAGFKLALSMGADVVFEMDADFSHDPSSIPTFLIAVENADVVVGSRYVNGVTVVNWPLKRLILSYFANVYTRLVTGLPLADATGGFKCFRREVLEAIDLDRVRSDGYAFQIEMNWKSWRRGFRILEIPIVFTDRRVGISKMNRKIIWEAVGMVWRMRLMSIFGLLD